jgi:hypothetical protein
MARRGARAVGLGVLAVLLVAVAGCSRRSGLMLAGERGGTLPQPPPDEAVVVFLRPAYTGYTISAAVYEDDVFLGVVMRYARLVHETTPGTHRFMVVSEAADFLDAELEGGKLYFVNVRPRMGVWRARFSLYPIDPSDPHWADLPAWLAESYPVTLDADGEAWARDNAASVTAKHDKYLPVWLEKPSRPTIRPADGVPAL